MPKSVGQIAQSAIETARAIINNSKILAEVAETKGVSPEQAANRMLDNLESDLKKVWTPGAWAAIGQILEAKTKTVDGKARPASDFLVVEDPDKPSTWRLPVKKNGTPDHGLMGAAKAALTSNHRGNPYEGPDKAAATKKLKALYKAEKMEWAVSEAAPSGLRELLEQALALFPDDDSSEAFTESAAGASGIEDFDGDLAELGIDAVAETGRRAPVLVDFQILKPGPGNKKDKHYYPREMVERDAYRFNSLDMFVTDHKEKERSERTKVGRVQSCPTRFTESGAPVGQVVIYDPDQAEKTRNRADAGELATMECSIYARGISKPGTIDGKEYKVVEAITEGKYLELVSSAGAGGHALNLSESDTGGSAMEETENVTEGVQEEDIQESEPAPVEEPAGETETTPVAETQPEPEPEALAEAEVEAALAETNLPGVFKTALGKGEYADADALKTAIAEAIAEVKALTGSGQPFGQGVTQPLAESAEDRDEAAKTSFNRVMQEVGLAPV